MVGGTLFLPPGQMFNYMEIEGKAQEIVACGSISEISLSPFLWYN
jgi:hypothetical protein